jgi:hypothetical protein
MNTETCSNCDRVIGRLEQAFTWQNHIVCQECYNRLSNLAPKVTKVEMVQPPRSIVKITLIVMATIIITSLILIFLFDYLSFHIHQFFSTGDW